MRIEARMSKKKKDERRKMGDNVKERQQDRNEDRKPRKETER